MWLNSDQRNPNQLRFSRCLLVAVLVMLLSSGRVRAQNGVLVHIETNYPEAVAYADEIQLGPARLAPYRVRAATRRIRLTAPRERTWSVLPVITSLNAAPGDTVYLTMNFPFYHRIETQPFGAAAWLQNSAGRTYVGTTPLLYTHGAQISGLFVLELEGYAPEEVEPREEIWNRYELVLTPIDVAAGGGQPLRPVRRRWWIDVALGAVAVAAGTVTVHYKFKADRINDTYQATGDPALRPRVAALDDRAGIALGVMQVGLGTLAIRFILR